jgi:hypothetical protein
LRNLLAVALLAWEPLNFAVKALTVLPTLVYRGIVPAIELVLYAVVAGLNAGAGLALLNRTPAAHRLATIAVLAACARTIHSVTISSLPDETSPGTEPYVIVGALTVTILALVIIQRSARSSR